MVKQGKSIIRITPEKWGPVATGRLSRGLGLAPQEVRPGVIVLTRGAPSPRSPDHQVQGEVEVPVPHLLHRAAPAGPP